MAVILTNTMAVNGSAKLKLNQPKANEIRSSIGFIYCTHSLTPMDKNEYMHMKTTIGTHMNSNARS